MIIPSYKSTKTGEYKGKDILRIQKMEKKISHHEKSNAKICERYIRLINEK